MATVLKRKDVCFQLVRILSVVEDKAGNVNIAKHYFVCSNFLTLE